MTPKVLVSLLKKVQTKNILYTFQD
ncbi:UNVERIFIED_CONTAM: hypothetical protein GTU68_024723 [Idotea baltica]|nr:hypothetical protein [Idotea baltica]